MSVTPTPCTNYGLVRPALLGLLRWPWTVTPVLACSLIGHSDPQGIQKIHSRSKFTPQGATPQLKNTQPTTPEKKPQAEVLPDNCHQCVIYLIANYPHFIFTPGQLFAKVCYPRFKTTPSNKYPPCAITALGNECRFDQLPPPPANYSTGSTKPSPNFLPPENYPQVIISTVNFPQSNAQVSVTPPAATIMKTMG